MSRKKQKKPGKIFTVDADADTGENRSVQRRNWPVNGKTDTGCACEKPCRRHVRKAQVSASAEALRPLPGPGVSPASVSEYPKRIF